MPAQGGHRPRPRPRPRARASKPWPDESYRLLFEQSPQPMWVWDRETFAFVAVNDAAVRHYGYSRDEFLAMTVKDLRPAEDVAAFLSRIATLSPGLASIGDWRHRRKDGTLLDVEVTTSAMMFDGRPCVLAAPRDVTERMRAERQLSEAQALAHVGSWGWDLATKRLTWSDEHYRIFGLAPGTPIEYPGTLRWVHPADHAMLEGLVARALADHQPYTCVYRVLHADGEERIVEAYASVETDETGRPIRMHGTVQDITERQQIEEALRGTRREFRDIFEYASVGVFRSNREGRVLLANPAFARMLGYDSPEALGALDLARDVYVHPEEREERIRQYEPMGSGWALEIQWKRRDGTPIWVLLNARAVKDGEGHTLYFEGFVQDITERRRANLELARSRRRLRQLARRLQDIREQDRRVMAREIHDELGQALTALRMDLAWLRTRLPPDRAELAAKGEAMTTVVDRTIDAVRRISTALRPAMLDDLGLVAAIEWQAQDLAGRTGLRCALDLPAEVHLDDGRATTVFRILQEALTNVARHAAARAVRVQLAVTKRLLTLEVADDGRGVTPEELADHRALGLLGMRERALALGGELVVQAVPTGGTTVRLVLPLAAPDPAREAS